MSEILPCYADRVYTNGKKDHETIKEFLVRVTKGFDLIHRSKTGIIVVSITERDENWKQWIRELQKIPQVTFTRTRTKYHEGNYWCFLACFPCHPE